MSSKICLVSDPRPQNPYGKLYSVEFLGNVVGGKRTVYNNQPIEALMKATAESINRYGTDHKLTMSEKFWILFVSGDHQCHYQALNFVLHYRFQHRIQRLGTISKLCTFPTPSLHTAPMYDCQRWFLVFHFMYAVCSIP